MAAPSQRLKETKCWFCWSISGPFSKGTSFSRMLLLGPFRTTHSYFDNSVSIGPTSVSHCKWMLSKHPQYMPNVRSIPLAITEIALIQFLSGGPERTIYLQTKCHRSQGRSIQRWTGEQPTRLPHGNSSSGE